MSQTFTDDCYASSHQAASDLQIFENNFAALKSMFSGATAPANLVAGMHWYDTAQKCLKMRDSGDTAWFGIMHGDASQKLWVYRNAAMEGWAIDSSVTDCVLALKGGGTYVTGGTTAGTWTQPDCTLDASNIPAHTHSAVAAHQHALRTVKAGASGGANMCLQTIGVNDGYYEDLYTYIWPDGIHTHTSVGGGIAHNHGTTYRIASAVGTMQYLDLT